jgi:hypothetical protein
MIPKWHLCEAASAGQSGPGHAHVGTVSDPSKPSEARQPTPRPTIHINPNSYIPQQEAQMNNPEAKSKIEFLLAALHDSWNRHDRASFASQFAQGADFVNVIGMHLHGRPAIATQHVAIHKPSSVTAS